MRRSMTSRDGTTLLDARGRAWAAACSSFLTAMVALALPLSAWDAAPDDRGGDYVGAAICAGCHKDQFEQQSRSGHARSLRPLSRHEDLRSLLDGIEVEREPGYRYRFFVEEGELRVTVSGGDARKTVPVEWAFGAMEQAITFVSQVDEDRYVEHHLSYYAALQGLAPTPGHQGSRAANAEEALGVYYETFDPQPKIMRCFQCHSTGPLALGPNLSLEPRELGIRCEACHGPGRAHVEAIAGGEPAKIRASVRNPKNMSARQQTEFCGACHRPPASDGASIDWRDPWNVRHQPVYLTQSKCFVESPGSLSCFTCHDPHNPLLQNDPAYYSGKCRSCHDRPAHPAGLRVSGNQADSCIGCHMPAVVPQEHLRFTNHWIGVYDPGAVLRPRQAR